MLAKEEECRQKDNALREMDEALLEKDSALQAFQNTLHTEPAKIEQLKGQLAVAEQVR